MSEERSVGVETKGPGENVTTVEINAEEMIADGKNAKQMKCRRCPSIILIPGMATFVSHEFRLPELNELKNGEKKAVDGSLQNYWCVDDIYAFENVGFSNNVGNIKYLTCADCEIEAIGWHDTVTKLSYVCIDKVDYC